MRENYLSIKHSGRLKRLPILIAVIWAAPMGWAVEGADFIPLGFSVGTRIVDEKLNVSEDGSVAVAVSLEGVLIRWDRQLGMTVVAEGVRRARLSGDGSTIVGEKHISDDRYEAIKVVEGAFESLPMPQDGTTYGAWQVSHDGGTIYGNYFFLENFFEGSKLVKWTSDDTVLLPLRVGFPTGLV